MTGIKRLGSLFLCAFLSVFLLMGALYCRAGEARDKGSVTVLDEAAVLMEEEADWLKGIAEALAEKSGWSISVATCKDAGGKSAQAVCEEYFNRHTDGGDGISCLADLDNQELYLATSGTAQQYLTDSRLDQILEDARAAAEEEDYAQALYLMLYEADQAFQEGIKEDAAPAEKEGFGIAQTAGSLAVLLMVAGGSFWFGRIVRNRSFAGRRRKF